MRGGTAHSQGHEPRTPLVELAQHFFGGELLIEEQRATHNRDRRLVAAAHAAQDLFVVTYTGGHGGTVALTEAEPTTPVLPLSPAQDQIARASSSNASISRCFGAASMPSS